MRKIWLTVARHLGAYRLCLRCSDTSEGEIDLSELVLNDGARSLSRCAIPPFFSALRADMDTVARDSGFGLAPEYLHARATSAAGSCRDQLRGTGQARSGQTPRQSAFQNRELLRRAPLEADPKVLPAAAGRSLAGLSAASAH